MKKFYLLTKTLLVAALLMVGANAWAAVGDKTTNLDVDFSNAISEGSVTGAVGSMTIGGSNTAISDEILLVGNGTSTATLEGSAAGSGDQVSVAFDLAFGKLVNKNVWFRLKDKSGDVIGEFNFSPYGGTLSNSFGVELADMYYANNTVIWDRKVSFNITLDYKARKITTATKCFKSGTGKAATEAEHTVDMTNSNPMASFEIGSNYNNDGRRCSFDNLKVVTTEGESAISTSYTVYYKNGEDVVKTVSSDDAVVGQVVTALIAIDGDDTKHYLITAAEAPSMTLVADAASNVLNVPVRAPYTATLNVTTEVAGVAESPVSKVFTETDEKVCSWSYEYSLYVERDNKFYLVDKVGTYGESGTFTDGEVINKTVSYTNEASDVEYFEDGIGKNYTFGASGGYTGVWGGDAEQTQIGSLTLDAGNYEVTFYVWAKSGSGSNHRGEQLDVNGTEAVSVTGNINGERKYIFNVANDASTIDIYGKGTNKATDEIDYVLIKKVPASVSATITSAGYATFSSIYPVSIPDGVEAYAVKYTGGNTVSLNKVEAVPANTGVVLKAVAGEYNLPVANADAIDTDLKVSDGTVEGDQSTIYVLNNKDDKVGFYQLKSGNKLEAGKAYLKITANEARGFIGFDEATGVNEVKVNKAAAKTGKIYNLNGQIVSKPSKGLFIVDGKVVSF